MGKFKYRQELYGTSRIENIDDVPVIRITSACTHECVFCSAPHTPVYSDKVCRAIIDKHRDTLSIEGGEPTLSADLPRWIKYARKKGCRDIIICTNGMRGGDTAYVRGLLDAGATMFNVNFPAHTAPLFDRLTGTKGQFANRVEALRNLMRVAGPGRVRITLVVHSGIMRHLPAYAGFVAKNFPGLFYLELNLAKALGKVMGRTSLVPRLARLQPYLNGALRVLSFAGVKFITDGFPLCRLTGFEASSIDVYKRLLGIKEFMTEKRHAPRCAGCSLLGLCAGPRADYLEIYGDSDLRPSPADPEAVLPAGRSAGFLRLPDAPKAPAGKGRAK